MLHSAIKVSSNRQKMLLDLNKEEIFTCSKEKLLEEEPKQAEEETKREVFVSTLSQSGGQQASPCSSSTQEQTYSEPLDFRADS